MKKLILLNLLISISFLGFSQPRALVKNSLRNIPTLVPFEIPADDIVNVGGAQNPYVSNPAYPENFETEDIIGRTYYDLQSNGSLSNRIYYYDDDGTVGAVWTMGIDGAPSFEDRGTGYSFFDGYNWNDEPVTRVENERTGWPSYAPLGDNGEIIIAHNNSTGLVISTRQQKGEGEWSFSTLSGPEGNEDIKWPRIITAGEDNNTIHLLVNSYNPYEGQEMAMLYYRSQDGGNTWDIEAEIIEGTDADYYSQIGSDNYVWADASDGTIAFLVASTWHNDMFMMKSTDNGDSWEKTIIWEHPYPFFDWGTTLTDTFYCVDNSATITLDFDGNAHVAFGITRAMNLEIGSYFHYFHYTDGIGYWNETMPTFSNNLHALSPYSDDPESELTENYNLVGWTQDVNGNGEIDFLDDLQTYSRQHGLSSMPSIGVDFYGNVLLAYSSTTETYQDTNDIYNYKHIWERVRLSNGTWGSFSDINSDIAHMFDECIYPAVIQHIGNYGLAYLLYQADYNPGIALNNSHGYVENRMIVRMSELYIGVEEQENKPPKFTVSQNTPNPAITSTTIIVNTEKLERINLNIKNILGQEVYNKSVDNSSHSYSFNVDVSNLDSGIYFYTIEIGDSSVTKKMLIK